MTGPWLFAQWELDLIGPLPQGTGQLKFAVVAVDYFTKWTEAEALATITATKIEHFVWKNILCRFNLPNAIVRSWEPPRAIGLPHYRKHYGPSIPPTAGQLARHRSP
ncbi:unnamed protein product [Prunus armeniaca]